MGVKRQRQGAIGDLFGNKEIATSIAEFEVVALQVQRMAISDGFNLGDSQIIDDGIATGSREACSKMDEIEQPIHLGHMGTNVRRLDALK